MDSTLGRAAAWDALYRSTAERVWGEEPLPFVTDPELGVGARLPAGGRVLDAGAGEGRHLAHLLSLTPGVHAVDASPGGLAKVPGSVRARVGVAVADLGRLPYPDGAFDVVLCTDVLVTVADPLPVLVELGRVLRAGGDLLCNVPDEDDPVAADGMVRVAPGGFLFRGRYFYRFMDEASAVRVFAAAGLRVVSSRVVSWSEEAHPNFREGRHRHASRVFVARRDAGG